MNTIPPPLSGDRTDSKAPADSARPDDMTTLAITASGYREAKLLVPRISPGPKTVGKRFSYQEYTVPAWN